MRRRERKTELRVIFLFATQKRKEQRRGKGRNEVKCQRAYLIFQASEFPRTTLPTLLPSLAVLPHAHPVKNATNCRMQTTKVAKRKTTIKYSKQLYTMRTPLPHLPPSPSPPAPFPTLTQAHPALVIGCERTP